MSDMNWRDKADEDLTSEDVAAMAAEGTPVVVRGPASPAGARFLKPTSWGSRQPLAPLAVPASTPHPVGTHFA